MTVNAVAMILRVWAMYHRSKFVLGTLLVVFIAEAILALGIPIIMVSSLNQVSGMQHLASLCYSTHLAHDSAVVPVQVLDFNFCVVYVNTILFITWLEATAIVQLVLVAMTCILISIQYARETFYMYKIMKTWRPNHYTKLFFQEGLLYFFV